MKAKKNWYLIPFSILYWLIVHIRNRLFDLNILSVKEFDIPVFNVGNITVGGTGKTPHIEHLVDLLKDRFKIATLSRGYKRESKGFVLSDENSLVSTIGDEPKQIKNKYPDVDVAVDTKRVRGIETLIKELPDLEAVLLDDAFQHRHVKCGISILLIDFNRLLSNDFLLPVGRLREPAFEARRANIIVVTKCPPNLKPIEKRLLQSEINPFPYQKMYFTNIIYGNLTSVFNDIEDKSLEEKLRKQNTEILLVTGIADYRPFRDHIESISSKITDLHFSDHYNYKSKDIISIQNVFNAIPASDKIIITTEKDAARLREAENIDEEIKKQIYFLPIRIGFLYDQRAEFDAQIIDYINKNEMYRQISENGINGLKKL